MSQRVRFAFRGLALAACAFAWASSTLAEEWGTLKGRFVVQGNVPAAAAIDQRGCPDAKLVSENLVVGDNGELANVLVYVRDEEVEAHPRYAATAQDEVTLEDKDCRFEPHVVLLRTTQMLVLKNSDPTSHITRAGLYANASFVDLLAPGKVLKKSELSKAEKLPGRVDDSCKPWMSGYILIRGNPYSAVSKADGSFEIMDLPAGKELEFQLWQEKSGYLTDIKGAGGFAADAKGRAKWTVKPGVTDLGEIMVPASLFAR